MTRPERRFTPAGLRVERRAGSGGESSPVLIGHAAVFDQWTTLYEGRYWTFREVVRPGAFKEALAEDQDVRSLFNHDSNFVLGRSTSGTLSLREDARGLFTETHAPATATVNDLVVGPVERGDVSQMSFAFLTRKGDGKQTIERLGDDRDTVIITRGGERITEYEEGVRLVTERELLSVDLFDVSVVTFPAYEGTDISVRSRAEDFEAREARAEERLQARRTRARMRDRLYVRMRLAGVGSHHLPKG